MRTWGLRGNKGGLLRGVVFWEGFPSPSLKILANSQIYLHFTKVIGPFIGQCTFAEKPYACAIFLDCSALLNFAKKPCVVMRHDNTYNATVANSENSLVEQLLRIVTTSSM